LEQFVRAAHALSDPTRVRVLHLLMQRECCVCEVMDVLGVSQVNASRYCNTLKDAGFLFMRKEGRWKLYSVDRNRCNAALTDMMQAVAATAGTSELCRLDLRRLASVRRRPVSEAISAPTMVQQSA
jgi:ArsR family transcriptional regulator, arsenate/arsenite/antimonite-responsive transcriptional repressor